MHSSKMRTIHCSSCLPGGCLPRRGVSAQGVFLGGSAWGMSARGWGVSGQGVNTFPLWTELLTHTCENITFPQLHLWTVKIKKMFQKMATLQKL